jgi:hypothetical protein
MIGLAALHLLAAAQTGALQWESLPPLPFRAPPPLTPEMNLFVMREAVARKCPLPPAGTEGQTMQVQVAVLIDDTGAIRTTVPRAIQCPTVEQYAAALVAGFARNNLLPRMSADAQWYRTSLTFTWGR